MNDTMTRRMWIAYGQAGATGTIIQDAAGYTVTMTKDSHRLGVMSRDVVSATRP